MKGYYRGSCVNPPPSTTTTTTNEIALIKKKLSPASTNCAPSLQKQRNPFTKLTHNYSILQSIVPNLLPKASKQRILTETVEFIRLLEAEKRRLERLKITTSSPPPISALSTSSNRSAAVEVSVGGGGLAFFGIELGMRRRNMVVEVVRVFEEQGVEILAASVAADEEREVVVVTVTAAVGGGYKGEKVVEDIKRGILVI